ncbi:Ig-like domain-containing protein [Roseivirga echinicomitans]
MNTSSNASIGFRFPLRGVQLLITLMLSLFIFSEAEAQIPLANSLTAPDYIKSDGDSDDSITPFFYSGIDNDTPYSKGTSHALGFNAPTAFTGSIDQAYINAANVSSLTFTYSGAIVGGRYDVSVQSSGGGTTSSGGNAVTSAAQTITVFCSACVYDGTVTISYTFKDGGGNPIGTFTDTRIKDTGLPSFDVAPTSSNITDNSFDLNVDMNEAGKVYYVIVADGATAPTVDDVKAGNANGGGTPATSGNTSVTTGSFSHTFNITDLSSATEYDVYAIVEDVVGNLVNAVSKIDITTAADSTNPVFTSATTANFAENGTGTAYTAVATDANTVTYSLGTGNDEALFNIVGATGLVTFKNSPNFESPKDADANNTYVINVIASDGVNAANQDVTITVTDVNENPSITSTAVTAVKDNETYSYKIATSDLDNDVVTVSAATKPDWLTLKFVENEVSTFAGAGNYASVDGTGTSASFNMPDDIVLDASGNMYVSDFGSNKIRKITTNGVVTTFAGSGVTGSANGNGVNASFNRPRGLTIDAAGNIYVADRDNNVIRKITPSGDVTTYAGSGAWGSTNGASSNARFNSPNGVAVDASGNLFVTDGNNNLIRKIDTNGNVSTFASVANPFGIAIDAAGNLYVTERDNDFVRKIAPNGVVTTLAGTGTSGSTDGPGLSASFNYPSGITVDAAGNVYVADKSNHKIRKIAPDGEVTTVAFVADATGITVDASGVMYASTGRNKIEKISSYYLLFGSAVGHAGKHDVTLSASDGNGATASQSFEIKVSRVLTPDANNILYVNKNVSGDNNRGGSWANAVTELADALVWAKENYDNAWATTPLKIFVVKGTYKPLYSPEDGVKFGTNQGRDNSFLMVNNVQVYGGFDPDNGIDDLTDSRVLPSSGSTGSVLSGDVNDNDGSNFANNSENSTRVIVSSGDVGKALLNGFTITGANGENNNNITVNGNPVYQCSGAGVYNSKSSPIYENLLLFGNHNTESGGGMFSYQSSPKVRNTVFRNNKAKDGGAMANQDNSSPVLTNVIFIQNEATANGGAIYNVDSSTPTFVNITVVGNTDTGGGDGIYNENNANPALHNSIIWDVVHGTYTAQNSLIKGQTDTDNGNLNATEVTNASLFTDYVNGDYSLKHNSPAVDAGSNALYTNAGGDLANDVDIAGNPRLYDSPQAIDVIDLGVYEYRDIINPVLTSLTTANFVENGTGTVYTVTATDENAITYSLGAGNDEGLFNIIGSTGVVTFKTAPDFENPTDGDANNTYVINVIASDGKNAVNQNVTITVTDVDDTKPVFTSATTVNFAENGTGTAYTVVATDANTVTYSLGTGNDEALFNIVGGTGVITFKNVPDFENPSDDGANNTYIINVIANDGINSSNQDVTISVTDIDEIKPTVTITSASTSPHSGAFDITVTFSESVTGFVVGDLTVANGTASNFAGSGTTYTATITPSADGAVTVNVVAGVAQDAAGNTNTAATQLSITNDETKPTVTVTSASTSPHSGAFGITVTFSESVTGFVVGDLTVANGTASNFAGSGTAYTATITPSADGAVTVNVAAGVAQDAAGNTNTAATQFSITNDETKPTVTVTSASTSPNSGAFDITITFSEVVTGFVIGDMTVANGTASNFAGSGTTYTATITPNADGAVTVNVAAGVAQDAANNTNTAATQFSITNDQTKPTVTLTAGSSKPVAGVYVITAQFSESVTGFELADIIIVGGTVSSLVAVDADTYTFSVASSNSSATVKVDANSVTDAAGNKNLDSNILNLIYNLTPTDISLSGATISENNSIGQLVGNLSTTDADATDTHTYSMVSGTGATDNASFTIAGNKLQAAEVFDFETKSSYSVRIKTDDGRGGTFEKQFTVSVANVAEALGRIEANIEIPTTALGLTSNFNITIHNEGDIALTVNSAYYPDGFLGLVTGLVVNPGESKVVTLGFKPTDAKRYTGTITFFTNAGILTVGVTGEGAIITGVDDELIDADEINLFPNPAQDVLNIDLSKLGGKALDISIINAAGTPIFTKTKFTGKTLNLNVSGYTNGLYIVQFTDGISVVRKKVMITK